jgi:F420-non-reducing hydrogenase large subunit
LILHEELRVVKRVTIDPITRLEGHGKIDILLDDGGNVKRAFFQVPELRGFEKFCEGRLAEELPRITPKICGVCPTAHHMASGKALDMLFGVNLPPAAKKIREMVNAAFMFEDHMLHFFYLGGPDFIVGPDASKQERNIIGVLSKVGLTAGKRVIAMRRRVRDIIARQGGRVIHPVCNLPGGVSKGVSPEDRDEYRKTASDAVEFARFAIETFNNFVLKENRNVDLLTGDVYYLNTYYMGLVDEKSRVNFYDGDIRIVTPEGSEYARFEPRDYLDHIAEHVEPWTYVKFPYLKKKGWRGFRDGKESGVFRVAPLARLNASEGMATPLAQEEYEHMYDFFGRKPLHNTLAYHWSRLIETLYAAERLKELSEDEGILDPDIRTIPEGIPRRGVGVVEAPRGTLIHDYSTDSDGRVTGVNLIVATVNNAAAISMSIERAARKLIKNGKVSEGVLNMVEMAFRAYDPCLACASHALGRIPLTVRILDEEGKQIEILKGGR